MKQSINIMHVVLSLDCGGLEKLAIELAGKFNNDKYKSSICSLNNIGDLADMAREQNIDINVARKRNGFDIALPFHLSGIFRKKRVDIVHTHNSSALIYGTLGAWLARVPVTINTKHGQSKLGRPAVALNINNAIITISEDSKRRLLGENKINPNKVRVIYNGVRIFDLKTDPSVEDKKEQLGIDKSCQIIGTVSRLAKEKDQFTLLDAFSKICRTISNVRLVFIGDGQLKEELSLHSRKLGLIDMVHFLGFKQDVKELISIFDIFVLSSLTEGVSLSLLEAMAASKPVVATNVGGNPEVVVEGETGFLVPPKDPVKMAEAILRLINNKDLARRMGEAGRRRVEERFSLDRMVREYEQVYEECLARRKHVGRWKIDGR